MPTKCFKWGGLCRCLLLIFLISAAADMNAQTTLFYASGLTKANLAPADIPKYEYYEYSPKTEGLWLMYLNSFSSQVADGYLEVTMPGNTTLRRYKARYVETKPNGDILWYGDLVDEHGDQADGYASLSCYGGQVMGRFVLNETDYALYPVKDNVYLFVQEDDELTYTCGYQEQEGEEELASNEEVQDRGCDNAEVKVMVLYTPAAQLGLGFFSDINQTIDGLIFESNAALQNSLVFPSQLRFSLIFKGLLSGFSETNNVINDLAALRTDSTVEFFRNSYGADCVVLLTNGDYSQFLGLTAGLGSMCTTGADKAYSIVNVGALSRMTFTHELGHQFGCKHGLGHFNGSCEPDYERPYSFRRGGRDKYTIMETNVGKKNRIPHFSNPDPAATWYGYRTGRYAIPSANAPETNNARQLREKAAEVSNYRNSASTSLAISGLNFICKNSQVTSLGTFTANVCDDTGTPYTLDWQISLNNGTIYGPVISTATTLVLDSYNYSNGDIIYIRLTHTNSVTNVQTFTYHPVLINSCGREGQHTSAGPAENGALQLAPNPTMGQVAASLYLLEASPATITLLDASGLKIRLLEQQTLGAGESNFHWDLGDLPAGMYQLQTVTNRSRTVEKIAIFH